ncbi:MAG TPA: hypothetical protein VFA10_14485 [Ktedonobacteraceae bacterium]|nr:hypothetical protein [Ktedonobacteraceae bacterium]
MGYDFEDVYQDILVLLQKIDEASFTWEIFDDHFVLQQKPGSYWYPTAYDEYLLAMQHQANTAKDIFSLIQEHEEELVDLLAFDSDWITEFAPSEHFPGFRWCECSKCGHIALEHFILGSMYHEAETLHKKCLSTDKGNYHIDSPRLMEAYTAARQARFDGRGGI